MFIGSLVTVRDLWNSGWHGCWRCLHRHFCGHWALFRTTTSFSSWTDVPRWCRKWDGLWPSVHLFSTASCQCNGLWTVELWSVVHIFILYDKLSLKWLMVFTFSLIFASLYWLWHITIFTKSSTICNFSRIPLSGKCSIMERGWFTLESCCKWWWLELSSDL